MAQLLDEDLQIAMVCPGCRISIEGVVRVRYRPHLNDPLRVIMNFDSDQLVEKVNNHLENCTGVI